MNEGTSVGSGTLLAESIAILGRNWPLVLVGGMCEGLIQFGQKIEDHERLGGLAGILLAGLLAVLVQMAVQGVVSRAVFVREGIADAGVPARFGAYIGVSLVVLLGTIFGSILLVVPGILLALRWSLAANFTLVRETGIREALEASRDATAGHRGEIFGAYVVFRLASYAPMIVLVPLAGGISAFDSVDSWSVIGAFRAVWSILASTAGLALSIGIFSVFVGRHGHLQEVFA
jgi:hypothetical protein